MSTYRGFDTYLISRANRAKGDHFYFHPDTLAHWNAFGGVHFPADPDTTFIVESVKGPEPGDVRTYRVIVVMFTHDDAERPWDEYAHICNVEENLTRAQANRAITRIGMTYRYTNPHPDAF